MISWFEPLGESAPAVLPLSKNLTSTEVNQKVASMMTQYVQTLGTPEADRSLCLDVRAYLTYSGLMLPEEPDITLEHRKEGKTILSFVIIPLVVMERIDKLPA